jgi:hypothetical protein
VADNVVIHHDCRSLVASAETRNITDRDFLGITALEGAVENRPHSVTSTKVTAHIGTDANVYPSRRAEMKVGIKAGYSMNLTDRDSDFCSQHVELLGWQVTEVSLYGP